MIRRKISRMKFIYILVCIVVIIIPNLPYKIPIKLSNSNLTELELVFDQSSGGHYVKGGNESLKEYAIQNGYSKIDSGQIYLTDDNIINKTLMESVQGASGVIRYDNVRVYGKVIGAPDKYGILTFSIEEWYPIGKYIAIKDTRIWSIKYKIFYFVFIIISVIVILIKEYYLKNKKIKWTLCQGHNKKRD